MADLAILLKGLKRKITSEKQSGNRRIETGKLPMIYAMNKKLAGFFVTERALDPVSVCPMVPMPNLESDVSKYQYSFHPLHHIKWREDCLTICFVHVKNDHSGDRKQDPRHIYANPVDL